MKIVVIGDGKIGYSLTQALSREGHDLMVIDNQKKTLTQTEEMLDVMVLEGNGASSSVQKMAGVDSADLMIAVTNADEINLLCCVVARKLGCKHTIARIRNPEYAEELYLLRDELGLSMTVNPERSAAKEIFGLLQYPSFLKRDSFAKGRAEIVELPVREDGKLCGMVLAELYRALKVRVLVCAVERAGTVHIPDGRFMLQAGDHIYVTAATPDLMSMVKSIGLETPRIHSVMIVGGSRIAYYLTQMLLSAGIKVKLIETQRERCDELCALLPKADVVHADGSSFQALLSEGIEETDAVVTLTNFDGQNIIISMYANSLHVPKVVSKINRPEYASILPTNAAECIISPRLLTSNDIVRYVRAMQNRQGAGVIALHHLVEDKVEALEFHASAGTWYLGVPLKDVPLKADLLLALISKRGRIIVPSGGDSIAAEDTVVIVTTAERNFSDLNDVFSKPPQGGADA